MKKLLFISFMTIMVLAFALPAVAQAHVLKVDGSIGAVLHINPDDNPVAGDKTQYILSFSDSAPQFNLPDCNCDMHILKNGAPIVQTPLAVTTPMISENTFQFPEAGVYTLEVTGTPKQPGQFPNFKLDYDVRVTDGKTHAQPFPLLLGIGVALAIGLILLGSIAGMYNEGQEAE